MKRVASDEPKVDWPGDHRWPTASAVPQSVVNWNEVRPSHGGAEADDPFDARLSALLRQREGRSGTPMAGANHLVEEIEVNSELHDTTFFTDISDEIQRVEARIAALRAEEELYFPVRHPPHLPSSADTSLTTTTGDDWHRDDPAHHRKVVMGVSNYHPRGAAPSISDARSSNSRARPQDAPVSSSGSFRPGPGTKLESWSHVEAQDSSDAVGVSSTASTGAESAYIDIQCPPMRSAGPPARGFTDCVKERSPPMKFHFVKSSFDGVQLPTSAEASGGPVRDLERHAAYECVEAGGGDGEIKSPSMALAAAAAQTSGHREPTQRIPESVFAAHVPPSDPSVPHSRSSPSGQKGGNTFFSLLPFTTGKTGQTRVRVATVTIELQPGVSAKVDIYEDDTAETLAVELIHAQGLDEARVRSPLTAFFQRVLWEALEQPELVCNSGSRAKDSEETGNHCTMPLGDGADSESGSVSAAPVTAPVVPPLKIPFKLNTPNSFVVAEPPAAKGGRRRLVATRTPSRSSVDPGHVPLHQQVGGSCAPLTGAKEPKRVSRSAEWCGVGRGGGIPRDTASQNIHKPQRSSSSNAKPQSRQSSAPGRTRSDALPDAARAHLTRKARVPRMASSDGNDVSTHGAPPAKVARSGHGGREAAEPMRKPSLSAPNSHMKGGTRHASPVLRERASESVATPQGPQPVRGDAARGSSVVAPRIRQSISRAPLERLRSSSSNCQSLLAPQGGGNLVANAPQRLTRSLSRRSLSAPGAEAVSCATSAAECSEKPSRQKPRILSRRERAAAADRDAAVGSGPREPVQSSPVVVAADRPTSAALSVSDRLFQRATEQRRRQEELQRLREKEKEEAEAASMQSRPIINKTKAFANVPSRHLSMWNVSSNRLGGSSGPQGSDGLASSSLQPQQRTVSPAQPRPGDHVSVRELRELEECTFTPTISPASRRLFQVIVTRESEQRSCCEDSPAVPAHRSGGARGRMLHKSPSPMRRGVSVRTASSSPAGISRSRSAGSFSPLLSSPLGPGSSTRATLDTREASGRAVAHLPRPSPSTKLVEDRLLQRHQQAKERLSEERHFSHTVDRTTGQQLFKPFVGR